jgi:hypothetical protein
MKNIALALIIAIAAATTTTACKPVEEAQAAPLVNPYSPSTWQYFYKFGDLLGTNPPGYQSYYGCGPWTMFTEACGWTDTVAEKLLQTIFGSANGQPPPVGAPAYCTTYSSGYCTAFDATAAANAGAPLEACGWGIRVESSGSTCWQRCGSIVQTRVGGFNSAVYAVEVKSATQITCPF